jgi:hypothetical protein
MRYSAIHRCIHCSGITSQQTRIASEHQVEGHKGEAYGAFGICDAVICVYNDLVYQEGRKV